ncbi:MAG: acyltransferase family protein [Ilumatobacteraceae bacterium]
MQRRTDIQGVRALAVLAVLLFHAGVPGLDGGYVGVDVFFVVSGYLITSLLVAERAGTGRISLRDFWARRVRRLLPVSGLVAVATLAASWLWLEPLRVRDVATDALAVATFSSNFVFADRGADYLSSSLPPSPFQHYWSLAVEEQFYVVWPLLVAAVCVGAVGSAAVRRRVGAVSLVVGVASFAACMVTMNEARSLAFYWPHTRAFELAAGALAAVVPVAIGLRARAASAAAAWVGLGVIGASVVLFDETTAFPGPWALVPVMATVLVLRGGDTTRWAPDVVLRLAPLQWLGSRSYSAYLWHWPALVVVAAAIGRDLTVAEGLAVTVAAVALAEFTWRWPEEPVRTRVTLRGVRAALFAAGIIGVVAGAGLVARNNPPAMATGTVAVAPVLTTTTSTAPPGPTTTVPVTPTLPGPQASLSAIVEAAATTGLPSNLDPNLNSVRGDMPVIYKNNCHAGFSAVRPKNCVVGDAESNVVVGVYGDSHAAQWYPAFEKIAIKNGWRLQYYSKRGCPPAEIEVYSSVLGKVYNQCGPWRANVLDQMVEDGVKVVIIAHFDRLLSAATKTPPWQKEWRAGLRATLEALDARGIVPVLMEDTPWPGQDVPNCLSQNYAAVNTCSQSVSQAYRDDMREIRADFQAEGRHVLWVRHLFCTESVCPNIVGNLLVYRDDNHISQTYASFIAPLVDEILAPFIDWYGRPRKP